MLAQYVVALGLACAILVSMAVFVLLKGPSGPTTRLFAVLSFSLALWSGTEAMAVTVRDLTVALWLWRLSHIGVIFIPTLFIHFAIVSLKKEDGAKPLLRVLYAISGAFLLANLTPWFIPRVRPKFALRAYPDPGPLYAPFVIWWLAVVAYGLRHLHRARVEASGAYRIQLQYMFWGVIIAVVGGAPNFLPVFDRQLVPWNPFGTYGVAIYALMTGYALVNYRFLEVPIALTRGVLLTLTYGVVLGVPALMMCIRESLYSWLGEGWWFAPFLTGAALAVAGPFVYFSLQRRIEARLLSEDRAYQSVLVKASLGMTRVRDVNKLLRLIVGIVTRMARIRHAALFLKNRHVNHYELVSSRHYGELVPLDAGRLTGLAAGARLPNEDAVVKWLKEKHEPLVVEELRLAARHWSRDSARAAEQLAFQLDSLSIAVIVPSFIEKELFGFLILGPKRSDQVYTSDDLDVFSTLANQAALAIENALSFEELQRAQAQLFQAQKMGTLGQMASGMSHQIHNRLTVLSLAAQNARINVVPRLEELLRKIVGLPAAVHQTMDELRRLYQVIEDESTRGSQIVRGLMEYSRPSNQQESVALQPLLEKAMEMLGYKHQLTGLQILQDVPANLPTILGSRSQLQDVFFNLLDNACDAVEEKQRQLEQATPLAAVPTYHGEVKIRATVVQQPPRPYVQVTVADNGIGMTSEEASKLFIPFFTTKATSVKGTGLGLFIIQKIVEAHGGRIRASSEASRGALFIVELPVG